MKEGNKFVQEFHRHHKPVVGHKFSIGVSLDGKIRGAVIVGRPVARASDDGYTLEVTRLVTDGCPNACSFLYSAAARTAKSLGYIKIQTYILDSESGVSLRASGWLWEAETIGRNWNCPSRHNRREDQPMCNKHRYVKLLK